MKEDSLAPKLVGYSLCTGCKYTLHPEVFQDLCHRLGTLDVDHLVSRFNIKMDRFVSRYVDPLAEAVWMLWWLSGISTP